MFKKAMVLTTFLVLTLVIWDPVQPKEEQKELRSQRQDAEQIARATCEGVGIVKKVSTGTRGAPILILEERHDSRSGQIQHAITLVRLHDRYGLKHIALEGYLKEDPEIKTDWFVSAAMGLDQATISRIAVRFLREGEISSAEFMKLVYKDLFLHPIETKSEYSVELDDEAVRAPILYLLKIALKSLREEHVPRLEQFKKEIENLKGNKVTQEKKMAEMYDYILSVDPWTQAKVKVLQNLDSGKVMSGEQQLILTGEIVNRAEKLSVEFEPEEIRAMERYLAFWRGRRAASITMVLSTGVIADRQDVMIVAMTTGAAHTDSMCNRLKVANRPFAVVMPLSLETREEIGDLTWDMLERKYDGASVYSEGFMKKLLDSFQSSAGKKSQGFKQGFKKPKPVLPEPWFQAKAELYLFTERIVRGILGPPNPPGDGKPPYSFSDDVFKGRWVFVDPKRISTISDTEDGKGRAVLFPAILNPVDREKRSVIWVKAGLGVAIVPEQERESVESMLMKALQDVRSEIKPSKRVEDAAGRVQITLNTVAAYSNNQQSATRIVLNAI